MLRVLVVEDGAEYTECFTRFLTEGFTFDRAGSGPAALAKLGAAPYDAVVLDMRFDRAPESELLGDVDDLADRFNGDVVQARRFLEDQQGTYVLAAVRQAGHTLPVLMSHDFSDEPRRWERLASRHGAIAYVPDNASAADVGAAIRALVSG
ncbi:MAG: hypothetical protein ABMB14_27225 [Myxococcota bacterium]